MAVKNKSNELKISRIYDAPVKAVWEAWTDPQQAAHWWGPRGFTITTHSKDLKVGGSWHYTMHGPDGVKIFLRPSVQKRTESSGFSSTIKTSLQSSQR